MRIAVFTSQFPGKVNTFFARDIRALLKAGADIDVFPLYPLDTELWRYVPDLLSERFLPRERVHHIDLRQNFKVLTQQWVRKTGPLAKDTTRVATSAARFGIEQLSKSMYAVSKACVWSALHPEPYDHILAYWGNYAATAGLMFQRLTDTRVPISMFLHAGTDLYRTPVYMKQKLLYVDNIIVVCEFNRQFIQKQYDDIYHEVAGKIFVHHLGLDFGELHFCADKRSSRKVLAVGNFEKVKGFDHLLLATLELKNRGVRIDVELVGDGAEASHLKSLSQKLGISDQVVFRGWLVPEEVHAAMRAARILVHPSISLGDAVPTVIKECMALGTAVVASDVAGIPELLDNGRCGILVPPRDHIAIANGIQSLLENTGRMMKYVKAARSYAEKKFDLWHNGRRLARLLENTRRRP
jgi:glycosyltransferase involved in cell wall biosynthesis